jgi:hypothetical protein
MLPDTSGLLCVLDQRDPLHALARAFYKSAVTRLTHSYVLAEFVPLAHVRGVPRIDALAFSIDLINTPTLRSNGSVSPSTAKQSICYWPAWTKHTACATPSVSYSCGATGSWMR